jgi:hypothetical protein
LEIQQLSLEEKNAIRAAAVPESIIEVKQVHPSSWNVGQQREEEERIYQAALKKQQLQIEAARKQEENIARSRTEDILHSKGWSRFPRPNERFFDLNIDCPYQCGVKVALLKPNSPNIGQEDYPLGTPLSMDHVDSYGNHTQLHNCVLPIKKNSELQYVIRRIEHLQNQNRVLNNALRRHEQDSTLHKGLFY